MVNIYKGCMKAGKTATLLQMTQDYPPNDDNIFMKLESSEVLDTYPDIISRDPSIKRGFTPNISFVEYINENNGKYRSVFIDELQFIFLNGNKGNMNKLLNKIRSNPDCEFHIFYLNKWYNGRDTDELFLSKLSVITPYHVNILYATCDSCSNKNAEYSFHSLFSNKKDYKKNKGKLSQETLTNTKYYTTLCEECFTDYVKK